MLKIGSLVDNKYKILSEVGHGGMSVVYLAINERANKTWAVKEVRKDGVCDFEAVKQGLVVETDMLKKLNHPYLPSIIDVIDTEDSFLIVMDYIEGKSLQSVLKNGAQPYELVIKWAMQLCDVLGYLHSREPAIIYRDMKPANVMLKPSGDITLIDFGTAREFKNRAMVEDTTCLGTRGYAAPEQFGGRGQTDPRTDIYCLGATMYHLITGHSPAEPPYEIKPLSYWDPSFYGSGIEHVISKCCQQDPNQRYQSCAELMYDLENIGDLDEQAKRKRKQKWAAFISSVALFGVGLVGMLGFSFGHSQAAKESYDGLILDAKGITGAENFQEFVGFIDLAIEVDEGRYEAYYLLLDRVESDDRLDKQTEWSAIYSCIRDIRKGNSQANEEYLLSSDQDRYAILQYRIGKLLFLMSEGTEADLSLSATYFDKALNKGHLESVDAEMANVARSLSQIGSSIESLNAGGSGGFTEDTDNDKYGFADLFATLDELVNVKYTEEDLGGKWFTVSLYSRVSFMMNKYANDFKGEQISTDEMLRLLTQVESALNATYSGLTEIERNSDLKDMLDNALVNVSTARNNINAMAGGEG